MSGGGLAWSTLWILGMNRLLKTVWTASRSFMKDSVDFLYPPCCPWCGCFQNQVSPQKTHGGFCTDCCQRIAPHLPDRCDRCSAPVGPYLVTTEGCFDCKAGVRRYERTFSLGTYQGDLKRLIQRCKRGSRSLAVAAAGLLMEQTQAQLRQESFHLILPVPHHWFDRVCRRDSVADILAEEFSRHLGIPTDRQILFKSKWTRPQQGKTAAQRRSSLKAAFSVNRFAKLTGLRVLLTDDVLTSGTTANRSIQVLQQAGVQSVHVAVLARTLLSGHKGIP